MCSIKPDSGTTTTISQLNIYFCCQNWSCNRVLNLTGMFLPLSAKPIAFRAPTKPIANFTI